MRFKKEELNTKELNKVIHLTKRILNILFALLILSLITLVVLLSRELKITSTLLTILKIASPFFIGLIIAWLFDPLVTYLNKLGVKRTLGSLFSFFLLILCIILFFRLLLPIIFTQLNELINSAPAIITSVQDFTDKLFIKLGNSGFNLTTVKTQIFNNIDEIGTNITNNLPNTVISILSTTISGLGTFIIGLFAGFYLLVDFNNMNKFLDFVPARWQDSFIELLKRLNQTLRSFVQGTLTIAILMSIAASIGFALIGLEAPLLFGIICGITNIIPYVGPWIGGTLAALVGFVASPITGILSIVVSVILQQIDGFVFQPLIMAKAMKLHPVTIIIGLLIFGYFFGIIGMLFATPCIAVIKVIFAYIDEKINIKQKIQDKENQLTINNEI